MGSIVSQEELIQRVGRQSRGSRRIVFTNGCFDLLHFGHSRLLEQARSYGDVLAVGLNSDASVRSLKGADRPAFPEMERAEILAALGAVDFVTIFEEDTPLNLIRRLFPNFLIKGGWPVDQIVGREEVEASGGNVISLPLLDAPSTTKIIEKIRALGLAKPEPASR
jgi:rfaE bifunctional protein nucleotidyltransferase chain/domain